MKLRVIMKCVIIRKQKHDTKVIIKWNRKRMCTVGFYTIIRCTFSDKKYFFGHKNIKIIALHLKIVFNFFIAEKIAYNKRFMSFNEGLGYI